MIGRISSVRELKPRGALYSDQVAIARGARTAG
jgi:hypothetical protein